jgi:hypothetical protein
MPGFRLRFRIAPGTALRFAEPLVIPLVDGVSVAAKSGEHGGIQYVNLQAEGMSEAEAQLRGARLRLAVRLAAAKLRVGVDTGDDRCIGRPGRVLQDMAAEEGVSLLPAVHGLTVFDATRPVAFLAACGTPVVSRPAPPFMRAVAEVYAHASTVSPKQNVALDVYNSSRFENSVRARFLSLTTVVECLVEQGERSAEARALLDTFMQQVVESGLSGEERERLKNALRMLQRESIRKACKDIVTDLCGPDAARFFAECYGARSDLVHDGTTSLNIEDEVERLDVLVSSLLLRDIEGCDAGD